MSTPSNSTVPQALPPTMLALRQDTYAAPPTVQRINTPQPLAGTAVLQVLFAGIISYSGAIYDGRRAYPYPTPLTLGSSAIARVAALGPDAVVLCPGDLCLLDVTLRSRDDIGGDDETAFLSALHHGHSKASSKLMNEWRDGTYAEYVRWPLENCHKLDEKRLFGSPQKGGLGYKMEDALFATNMLVSYGGLGPGCIDLKPGETVLVSPATGSFGSAAVHVALELGAGRVITMGRNTQRLEELKEAATRPNRVLTVALTGDADQDYEALKRLGVAGKIDVFFDISPPAASGSGHLKAAFLALKRRGRACLMGGLRGELNLPATKIMHEDITIKGKWMFEPEDVKAFIRPLEMGVVRLHQEGDGSTRPLGRKCMLKCKLDDWKVAFDEAERLGSQGFVVFEPRQEREE